MAATAVYSAMDHGQKKALHPFFSKSNGIFLNICQSQGTIKLTIRLKGHSKTHAVSAVPPVNSPTTLVVDSTPLALDLQNDTPGGKNDALDEQNEPRKRRKLDHDAVAESFHEHPPQNLPYPDAVLSTPTQLPQSIFEHVSASTGLPQSVFEEVSTSTELPQSIFEEAHAPETDESRGTSTANNANVFPQSLSPPKKMMQLKASGKLASPIRATPQSLPPTSKPAKRGRPKKEKHLMVVCRYTPHDEFGHALQRILDGLDTYQPPSLIVKLPVKFIPPSLRPVQQVINKPAHPFFSAKPKPTSMPPPPPQPSAHPNTPKSPRRSSAVTPGKLRAQRQQQKLDAEEEEDDAPSYTHNRDRLISKQPGMSHAPWPSKDMAHVRGHFVYHAYGQSTIPAKPIPGFVAETCPRKMKHKTTMLDSDPSLLQHYQSALNFQQPQTARSDGFHNPPPSLRLPTRHHLTGSEIQNRLDLQSADLLSIHPACAALIKSIPQLTPYDQGRSEPQAWSQKYAPQSSDTILQTGPEVSILRDWIRALTITSDPVTSASAKSVKGDRTQAKKRRKKAKGLDGFIVDSDEDMTEDYELEELPVLASISTQQTQHRPSLVRALGLSQKVSNAVVISGPPGCGKSAMVYAVAKELGFEVFEINPGSRRTGKDILDRVGDMVENHLVQRHSADTGNTSADEDAGRLSDAFNKDLQSGRQKSMAGFFTSKSKTPPAAKKRKQVSEPVQAKQQTLSKAKPARAQKQSLILLEEVDILFEEDKGFWQTVCTLILNSRRPVIMTCNDEDLVPLQTMILHAVLRLRSPPVELSAMYLELIAAKEGHILSRDDLSTLYTSTGDDLRASITNTQMWCQMGIGDPRGGLSWLYQRWPSGTGVSENGQPLRVVSEGSLQSGMGLVSHECESSLDSSGTEELLQQVWSDWNVDPRLSLFARSGLRIEADTTSHDETSRLKALMEHERLLRTLSDMDSFASVGLPGADLFDTTDPELSDKYRSNFMSGMRLLQTPTLLDHEYMGTRLAVSSAYLASRIHGCDLDVSTPALIHDITAKDTSKPLTRATFSHALDPLAYQCAINNFSNAPNMTYTSLDGPFKPITLDIAPYVRSIAAYDLALESQRARLGGAIGGGEAENTAGVPTTMKKTRTTRAARSALEGGQRALTRRERWFEDAELDLVGVLRTGGREWPRFGAATAGDAP